SRPICAWWLDFGEARAVVRLGRDWQARSPLRRGSHNPVEFFLGANVGRQFADNLIVHMEHHGIAGGLKADQSFNKKIACNGLHCVLNPSAAISALAIPAINKLTFRVVLEDDHAIAALVGMQPRLRIGEIATARQPHTQECAIVGEGDAPTADRFTGPLNGAYGRTIERAPEANGFRVFVAPALLIALDLLLTRRVAWREFLPRADAAHISECKTGGLADGARGLLGLAEALAEDVVRLVLRIAGRIKP